MGKVELKLEIDAELLARASEAGAEPQAMLEAALRALPERPPILSFVESARAKAKDPEGAARRTREWTEENREAIEDFNAAIERRGLLSDYEPFKPRWMR